MSFGSVIDRRWLDALHKVLRLDEGCWALLFLWSCARDRDQFYYEDGHTATTRTGSTANCEGVRLEAWPRVACETAGEFTSRHQDTGKKLGKKKDNHISRPILSSSPSSPHILRNALSEYKMAIYGTCSHCGWKQDLNGTGKCQKSAGCNGTLMVPSHLLPSGESTSGGGQPQGSSPTGLRGRGGGGYPSSFGGNFHNNSTRGGYFNYPGNNNYGGGGYPSSFGGNFHNNSTRGGYFNYPGNNNYGGGFRGNSFPRGRGGWGFNPPIGGVGRGGYGPQNGGDLSGGRGGRGDAPPVNPQARGRGGRGGRGGHHPDDGEKVDEKPLNYDGGSAGGIGDSNINSNGKRTNSSAGEKATKAQKKSASSSVENGNKSADDQSSRRPESGQKLSAEWCFECHCAGHTRVGEEVCEVYKMWHFFPLTMHMTPENSQFARTEDVSMLRRLPSNMIDLLNVLLHFQWNLAHYEKHIYLRDQLLVQFFPVVEKNAGEAAAIEYRKLATILSCEDDRLLRQIKEWTWLARLDFVHNPIKVVSKQTGIPLDGDSLTERCIKWLFESNDCDRNGGVSLLTFKAHRDTLFETLRQLKLARSRLSLRIRELITSSSAISDSRTLQLMCGFLANASVIILNPEEWESIVVSQIMRWPDLAKLQEEIFDQYELEWPDQADSDPESGKADEEEGQDKEAADLLGYQS